MPLMEPTYYVRHPDDSYSAADPQPSAQSGWQEHMEDALFCFQNIKANLEAGEAQKSALGKAIISTCEGQITQITAALPSPPTTGDAG